MSNDAIYAALAEQFPTEAHKTLDRAGGQTYVPWNLVAERLNVVLGVEKWSFRVIREGFTLTECWVLGELSATIRDTVTVRQQYGCSPIAQGQRETPVDDLMKKAGTDAFKKCAQVLGVALYLTDADERAEVKAAMQAEKQAAAKAEADARQAARQPKQEAKAPTPINDTVKDAAVLTGANPSANTSPNAFICADCHAVVTNSLDLPTKKDGPKTAVTVAEFAPVCEKRFGALYCADCYIKRRYAA